MTAPSAASGPAPTLAGGRYALGVDGGGTKTEAWISCRQAQGEPEVIGRGAAGASNPRAVGLEAALANLAAAIDAAWLDAGVAARTVAAAVLAISGAGHETMRDKIAAWARDGAIADKVAIVHDADPLLAAGTPEGWGVALIVGTGSAAIAADPQGERRVVGGWGYWYGDEGSAYWIGRRALEAIARAADGRAEPTALAAAFAKRLKADDPRAFLGLLEQTGNVRGAIAGLADAVAAVAYAGDATASAIVDQAANELGAMVASAAAGLKLGGEFPLAIAGGVACGSQLLRQKLLKALQVRLIHPRPVELVPHPAAGCVRLAWELLKM